MTDLHAEVRALLEQITPGEWHAPGLGEVHSNHDAGIWVSVTDEGLETEEADPVIADSCTEANAKFIAAAPRLVRALVEENQQLTQERNKLALIVSPPPGQDEDLSRGDTMGDPTDNPTAPRKRS